MNTTGTALTPHVAETICRNRGGRFVFTNTVFDKPEDGFERWEVRPGHFRLVSASRVRTYQVSSNTYVCAVSNVTPED